MVKKIEKRVRYEASDGREFSSEQEAAQHEAIVKAERHFHHARKELGELLANTQLTADGETFDLSRWSEYYAVTPGIHSMPGIRVVRFNRYDFDFDHDDVFRIITKEDGRELRFPINMLYSKREKALEALQAALTEYTETVQTEILRIESLICAANKQR